MLFRTPTEASSLIQKGRFFGVSARASAHSKMIAECLILVRQERSYNPRSRNEPSIVFTARIGCDCASSIQRYFRSCFGAGAIHRVANMARWCARCQQPILCFSAIAACAERDVVGEKGSSSTQTKCLAHGVFGIHRWIATDCRSAAVGRLSTSELKDLPALLLRWGLDDFCFGA